jgi:S1-C subfamily serine protease
MGRSAKEAFCLCRALRRICQNFGTGEFALAEDLKVFSPRNFKATFDVELVASNAAIDIAILLAPDLEMGEGLKIGSSDLLKQMDHIAIAGFPNYSYGDSVVLSPGLVIGFRTVSAIRRILVNTPIVAGISGGPALNAKGEVIGVAVTGADGMENAPHTEKHGVVPIEALLYLAQTN